MIYKCFSLDLFIQRKGRTHQETGRTQRLSKQKIQHVNAVRRDIVQRTTSGFCGIEQPVAMRCFVATPFVAGEFRKYGPANGAAFQQLFRALNFWPNSIPRLAWVSR